MVQIMSIDPLASITRKTDSSSVPPSSPTGLRGASGFTMMEVIAVLVLLGIMSAILFSHANNSGVEAELSGAADVVKSHLRFAQTKAMNSDLSWGINFSGATYTLQDANAVTAPLPTDLPQGVTFSSTVNPLMFDTRWGSPGSSGITVTVSKGGIDTTITVTANTGFIP